MARRIRLNSAEIIARSGGMNHLRNSLKTAQTDKAPTENVSAKGEDRFSEVSLE